MTVWSHPVFRAHDTGPGHPECAERLAVLDRLDWIPSTRMASPDELMLAHDKAMVDRILALTGHRGFAGEEVPVGPRSIEAARHAVGAALQAAEALGPNDQAWVLCRPPGHHAEQHRAMGFCVFNTVAITALSAASRGLRVGVLDWDVHHGNGTQDILWGTDIRFASLHQSPLYPDSGFADERCANVRNYPMPSGSDDRDYAQVLATALSFVVGDGLDLLIISAGFDAQAGDPLAGMLVTPAGFAAMADQVRGCGAPVLFVLEGGYKLDTLPDCILAAMHGAAG